MDCIILAGSGESYREVHETDNKAFLKVKDVSILHLIMRQLQRVPAISCIHIIGPKEKLEAHIKDMSYPENGKPYVCYQETTDISSNIMKVHELLGSEPDRLFLVMPSDVPLITAGEINQFLDRCDTDKYDFQTGMTTDGALKRFEPVGDKPGVKMAMFTFRGVSLRINNLHLVRPGRTKRVGYVRKVYSLRYQKQWTNVLGVVGLLVLLVLRIPIGIPYYFFIQGSRICEEKGWPRMAKWFSNRIKISTGERIIASGLGTRFRIVTTDLGGSAIDVDNEDDYQAIVARFDEWHLMQEQLAEPLVPE